MLQKFKTQTFYPTLGTPKNVLHHTLFVLNFLTLDNKGKTAADRFWHPQSIDQYATVM